METKEFQQFTFNVLLLFFLLLFLFNNNNNNNVHLNKVLYLICKLHWQSAIAFIFENEICNINVKCLSDDDGY